MGREYGEDWAVFVGLVIVIGYYHRAILDYFFVTPQVNRKYFALSAPSNAQAQEVRPR